MTLRPLLVVNPRSGGGRTRRNFPAMRAPIEAALGPVDVEWTERPGHGIEIARAAAEAGHAIVIAVGGDGSFHEVCNGVLLAGETKTAVGLIGQGTGGDFRRTLGIEHRLDRYLEALRSGRERRIDAGRLQYTAADGTTQTRFFVNILSAGLGGMIDRYVADMPPAIGGTAAYALSSIKALARCRKARLSCTVRHGGRSEERRLETYSVAICNGQYFGSGMFVAPMARPDDGTFEVVSLGAAPKLAFSLAQTRLYSGTHLRNPGVEHFRCDSIEVRLEQGGTDGEFLLDVDGEPLGRLPISVDLLPGAITLRA